jgi:segregation and condensation protein B
MVTAPEAHEIIEAMRKDELSGDIGKAGAETLAIVLYRGPISRAEIDRIRGVNSTFILRNLLIRGLVERRQHPTDSRSWVYATTPELMNHLGIQSREMLPDFVAVMDSLDAFEKQQAEEETPQNPLTS